MIYKYGDALLSDIFDEFEDINFEKKEKRRKDKSQFKVIEGVLDSYTLKVLYKLLNRNIFDEMVGVISSGKESGVYLARCSDGSPVAVKIYRMTTAETDWMWDYISGDPRFKVSKRGARVLIPLWASKEFRNLKEYYKAGVRVPKPIAVEKNVLVMEYIHVNGSPARLLKDSEIEDPDSLMSEIIEQMKIGYTKARLVHGDLSEYNILMENKDPVIIDVSQAVSIWHPYANKYLARDIKNILRFFDKLNVIVPSFEEVYEYITNKND